MPKLLINLTTVKDNPDKTVVAFVVAKAGVAAGQEVTIFLSVEAVRLAISGYADDIMSEGFEPLRELSASFTDEGGKLWVCPSWFNTRGLNTDEAIPGDSFAGGAPVMEFLAQGAASLS